jgi:DNA gyrase subunit B
MEHHNYTLGNGCVVHNTAIPARTSVYCQEILKLKGKPINAARTDTARYSANAEVFNILAAMGYKPSSKNIYDDLRVQGKLIFLVDPDVDGAHISLLLLALLSTVLPDLFKRGLVYAVDSPEYMTTYKGKRYYGRTKTKLYESLPKGAQVEVQHIKGWGEISAQVIREVAFDPKTRKLIQITCKKAEQLADFLRLMSDDRIPVKQLLGLIEEDTDE